MTRRHPAPLRPAAALAVALALALGAAPARAHHVGAYTPRDNEVSANFKQIKFALQARKFGVASRLYAEGALRRDLRARAATLPAALDATVGAALASGDVPAAEGGLMVFFMALVRELAGEADRRLADASVPAETRATAARKLLDAIWRYYNLVDFTVGQRDPRAATGIRLAFEEAEALVAAGAPSPERARQPLSRIARLSAGVIEASSSARRDS
jgi:hypothetical protein